MKAGTAQSGRTILAVIAAISMVMSLMAVYAMPADADHDVEPELIEETANQTCTDFQGDGQEWIELKQDAPGDGTVDDDDGPLTVEITNFNGKSFDWSSNIGVDAVFVKAGAEGSYLYRYDPPHEETSDSGLTTPGEGDSNEISHITFCYDVEDTTTTTAPTTTTTTEPTTTTTAPTTTTTTEPTTTTTAPTTTTTTEPTTTTTAPTTTTTTEPTTTTTAPTTTTTTEPTTTTTAPPESGEIVVQKVVTGEASQTFAFTFNTNGFTLGDNTLAHGESSSSGDIAAGDGYSVSEDIPTGWTQVSAVCDDGSAPSNIDVAAGETVTCTFTNTIESEVQASIVVTVGGTCEVDGDEGQGVIDVEISVDDGADVVISDSDGDVIETLSSSATVTVAEGATYTWDATPNEGFEFPAGSESSGSITIETCSEDPETLPFTGLDTGMMSLFASALLGGGLLLVTAMRRQEEA